MGYVACLRGQCGGSVWVEEAAARSVSRAGGRPCCTSVAQLDGDPQGTR